MKIIATYILYDLENSEFYKLHECIGINNFNRSYYAEYTDGSIGEVGYKEGKELIEGSAH